MQLPLLSPLHVGEVGSQVLKVTLRRPNDTVNQRFGWVDTGLLNRMQQEELPGLQNVGVVVPYR